MHNFVLLYILIFSSCIINQKSFVIFLEPLDYEGGKFSQKRSVGVFGVDVMTTGIPADLYRFYLIGIRPETERSSFNWSDFALTVNTELINNIGNFINR